MRITVAPHPLLDLRAFETRLPASLGACASPSWLTAALSSDPFGPSELAPPDDAVRAAVRDLLRHGGFKPSGRSRPASESLVKAVAAGRLGTINLAVDACNVVSLHSGLPVSVVDPDRTAGPLSVGIAAEGASYVFNASGQEIDVGGLLCLHDDAGPCANAVKDAQRTKTTDDTARTLSIVWGTTALPGRAEAVARWYRSLLAHAGGVTVDVDVQNGES